MPTEDKYKSVKTCNPRINSLIIDTPGALAVMETLGWVHEDEKLICKQPQTMSQVRDHAVSLIMRTEHFTLGWWCSRS
jgi:hypothetical protein